MEVTKVEINLYPGVSKNHLDYYADFLTLQNIRFKTTSSYFGNKIIANVNSKELLTVADYSCSFILDFYLKEAVISKIYDEYPLFNTNDASQILSLISEKITTTPIRDHIHELMVNKSAFNPESYVAFNMKQIMLCIYALTDDICQRFAFNIEKQNFISFLNGLFKNKFSLCKTADVEFSSADECFVSLNNGKKTMISSEQLISYLAVSAPEKVTLKNTDLSPELSDIVNEIFNSDNK